MASVNPINTMPTRSLPPDMHAHKTGNWLVKDRSVLQRWVERRVRDHDKHGIHPEYWDETVVALKEFIEHDSNVFELCSNMFSEIPVTYTHTPNGKCQVRDYMHMLSLFDYSIRRGPEWSAVDNKVGLVGFPINAILDWPMGTLSGYYFFKHLGINSRLNAMLNKWGSYLRSEKSVPVLSASANGWLAQEGITALQAAANGDDGTPLSFTALFKCPDPADTDTLGFSSWDQFFTREFQDNIRPLFAPETGPPDLNILDPQRFIVNACESAPLRLDVNVKWQDKFWLKGQPYSLKDMLQNDAMARYFEGGIVYQAFLSALSYHRWHAPLSGTVKAVHNIPGTYYSEDRYEGFANMVLNSMGKCEPDPDPAAPDHSQAYITAVAARAVIYIEADNKDLGTVGMVTVGM